MEPDTHKKDSGKRGIIHNSIDNPGTLCDGSYTYDRVGNVITREGTSYTYDGMNRLLTGAGTTYGYDEIGNITSSTGTDPASFSYEPIGGRDSMLLRGITRTNTQSVTDDAERGWITGIDTRYTDLRWDVYGRLEAIVDLARGQSGTQEDTYRYYPDGLRYRKDETATTGSVTTSLYLYEGNDILSKEMLEGTAWKTAQVNVRLGGQEIGRYVHDYASGTERLEYVWRDNVGSRRAVSDTAGTVKAKSDYSVWGVPTVTNYDGYDGSLDVSYTGKEKDATGLYYFNARYYDSSVGRFYSEDPVRSGGNWFIYCGNNPLSFTDPTGLADVGASNPVLSMAQYIRWESAMNSIPGKTMTPVDLQGSLSHTDTRNQPYAIGYSLQFNDSMKEGLHASGSFAVSATGDLLAPLIKTKEADLDIALAVTTGSLSAKLGVVDGGFEVGGEANAVSSEVGLSLKTGENRYTLMVGGALGYGLSGKISKEETAVSFKCGLSFRFKMEKVQ